MATTSVNGFSTSVGFRDCSSEIEVFSTCPTAGDDPGSYAERVKKVARWSEQIGCKGILVYSDNQRVAPWLVAQTILNVTESLCPLIALQPVYMHAFSAAKKVSSLALLHGRRIYLNLIAGGFPNDLKALDDQTAHDRRYDRLVEYTSIMTALLSNSGPVSFEGEFYRVHNLMLEPKMAPELLPGLLISGSSPAGRAAAVKLGATAVEYPAPADECEPDEANFGRKRGLRVGVIARETEAEAWAIAHERFPADRKGQLMHQFAMKRSDSQWHQKLSEIGEQIRDTQSVYWLHPFENYRTFCPYLVGSYDSVAKELHKYVEADYRTFILDIPASEEELQHIGVVFSAATKGAAQ